MTENFELYRGTAILWMGTAERPLTKVFELTSNSEIQPQSRKGERTKLNCQTDK